MKSHLRKNNMRKHEMDMIDCDKSPGTRNN